MGSYNPMHAASCFLIALAFLFSLIALAAPNWIDNGYHNLGIWMRCTDKDYYKECTTFGKYYICTIYKFRCLSVARLCMDFYVIHFLNFH